MTRRADHPNADTLSSATASCQPLFAATRAYEEPNLEVGAAFGYAVDAGLYGTYPRVFVGAPGTDYTGQPAAVDAGAVWVFVANGGLQIDRVDQAISPFVRGAPPQIDDSFGASLAYDESQGLLVGAPGNNFDRGTADWFEVSSGLLGRHSTAPGFSASDLLTDPIGARLGERVLWMPWEGGTASGPGAVMAAPAGIEAVPLVDTGAVIGIRGSTTSAGAAWSTSTGDLMTVTR